MMNISPVDVVVFQDNSVRIAARSLLIDGWDWRPEAELHEEVRYHCPEAGLALDIFLREWRLWYDYHCWIDQNDKSGRLDGIETDELIRRVVRKHQARESLRQWV